MVPTESLQEVVAFFHSFKLQALLLVNRTFASLADEQFRAGHLKFVRINCVDAKGEVYELLIGRVHGGSTTFSRSEVAKAALYDELALKLSNTVIECMTVRCNTAGSTHVYDVLAKLGPSMAVSKLLRVYVGAYSNGDDIVGQLLSFHKITAMEINALGSDWEWLRRRDNIFKLCESKNIASVTFVCPDCGKPFVEASSLTAHLMEHDSGLMNIFAKGIF